MARFRSGGSGIEDLRIQFAEELLMQRGDSGAEIGRGDDEAEIERGRALADHADVDLLEGAEDAGAYAGGAFDIFAHQTDDGLVALDGDLGELFEIGDDVVETRIVFDGERHADLGRRDHVDGGFVAVEDLENAAEKAVGHEHARGADIHDGDVFFAGDGFDDVGAGDRLGGDAGAGDLRTAGVEDENGDVFFHGGEHGGRVENFGAEVGELGGFGEGDALDAMAAGEHGGVAGEHAVDVGPDLDFLGADARANDGGGEVRAAAAERGGDAVFGGGDEAAHYDYVLFGERRDDGGEAGVGFRVERSGLGVAAVGDDQLTGVGVDGGQAVRLEQADDDEAGEALAEAGDGVDRARCQLAENGEATDEFGEFLKMLFNGALHAGLAEMKIAQIVEQRESAVAMTGDGGAGDFEQLISGFSH